MGKALGGARKDVTKRPTLAGTLDEVIPLFTDFYELTDEAALIELLTLLHGYSCRDQEGEPQDASPNDLKDRRAAGFALAHQIVAKASEAARLINEIELARAAFEDAVLDNTALLEEIFDVDVGPPDILFHPPELNAFKTFYSIVGGETTEAALAALAATPVRSKLSPGPVKNIVLTHAVAACREYWRDCEGRSWAMSALKHKEIRDADGRSNLQGLCEAFVADIIHCCGIRFTLSNLVTAWTEVDKLARINEGTVPNLHKRQLALSRSDAP